MWLGCFRQSLREIEKHMVKDNQRNNKTTNRDEPLNETEREGLERLREQLRMSKL